MTTNDTTNQTTATAKPKQPTPCERATAAIARTKAACELATKHIPKGEQPDIQTGDLLKEVKLHLAAVEQAAKIACDESVPYARRLTASGRAKLAADSAEGAAGEIKATQDRIAAEADDALLAQLENVPGYTKNPEWLAVQERIAARRF